MNLARWSAADRDSLASLPKREPGESVARYRRRLRAGSPAPLHARGHRIDMERVSAFGYAGRAPRPPA